MNATFPNRVRFNWGYHDAAHAVFMGWDNPGHFWGFAKALGEKIEKPDDVLTHHFDPHYASGWIAGYRDKKAGLYDGSSETAWKACQMAV